jgi:hypothetical protein
MFRNIIFYSIWIAFFQITFHNLSVASAPFQYFPTTKRVLIKQAKQEIKKAKKTKYRVKKNIVRDMILLFLCLCGLAGGLLATIVWLFAKGAWLWWFFGGLGVGFLIALAILIFNEII